MYCQRCGEAAPPDAHVCLSCGAELSASDHELRQRIATLKAALAAKDEAISGLRRFMPSVVADAILTDRERLKGERRDVTVLFVDAVGFTRLSVSLDAESVFLLIGDLLSKLVACVHRYEGVVDKFTGDGLMAVFGAPIAHENDAELAVRAALDMQRAAAEFAPVARAQLGAPIQVRIGVNRGPTIAGILGTQEQVSYTVIGETVNLAARIESLAEPGHVLVSAGVYTRTNAFFEFAPLQRAIVKGVDEPIDVYEALGLRDVPLSPRGIPGMAGIYLGRDPELAQLRELLAGFLDGERGRLATIVGEAGMGKSRLVQEWLDERARDEALIWHGRGLPYAQGTGYGVFRALFRDALDGYGDPTVWKTRVSEAFHPFVRRLMGLPMAPGDRVVWEHLPPERISQLTTLALREWLLNESRLHPLILILDDFHWADDLSRDALQSLVALTNEARILFCVIFRPFPPLTLDRSAVPQEACRDLEIGPLSDDESRLLLSSFVDLHSFPETTVRTILNRAEGNPFYIEEFVRMMIEQEALRPEAGRWEATSTLALENLDFPTSLRGLMMSRIDRLPDNLRHMLQDAAVVGLQFDLALMQSLEQRLRRVDTIAPMVERLEHLDLLERRPQAGPDVYAFRHILTQETAYRSILRNERSELHRVVAESIETLYEDDIEQHVEVLALHYDRARAWDKALAYTLRAGERAQARFANREAIDYYGRALQLSQHVAKAEAERWQAAVGLGDVEQHVGENEEAISFYQAALDEQPKVAPNARAEVMLKIGRAWDKLGDLEKADTFLKAAATEMGRSDKHSPAVEAEIYGALGWLTLRSGDLPTAQTLLMRAAALVDGTAHYNILSSILNRLGAVYFSSGEWDKAVDAVQRSLDLREQLGDILGVARSSNNLGILKSDGGDWQGALQTYQRCLEAMQMIGDNEGIAIAHTNMGNVYIDLGTWDKAEASLRRSFDIAQRIANPYEKAQANMNLGRLFLRKGEFSQAAPYIDTAISLYGQVGVSANPNLIDAYWLRGILHLELGQTEQAVVWRDRTFGLLKEGTGNEDGESPEWGRYHQLVGRVALALGKVSDATEHLQRAKSIFRINRSSAEIGRTAYWCAQAQLRADKPSLARDELIEARDIFTRLGAQPDLARTNQFLKGLEKATA